MGWVTQRPRPGISQETLSQLFELESNELSEIFTQDDRVELYQVVQKALGKTIRFEDARSMLKQKIKQESFETIYE